MACGFQMAASSLGHQAVSIRASCLPSASARCGMSFISAFLALLVLVMYTWQVLKIKSRMKVSPVDAAGEDDKLNSWPQREEEHQARQGQDQQEEIDEAEVEQASQSAGRSTSDLPEDSVSDSESLIEIPLVVASEEPSELELSDLNMADFLSEEESWIELDIARGSVKCTGKNM